MQALPEQAQLQLPRSSNGSIVPQRQVSAASEVSSLGTEPALQGSPGATRGQVVHPEQQQSEVVVRESPRHPVSPVRQRAPVTLRDDPVPKVDTPVTATPADKDDIYGATPRLPADITPQEQQQPQRQHLVEHVIVVTSPSHTESSTERDSKFAGMPNNKAAEPRPEFRVEPPPTSPQTFSVISAPAVIVEPASATSSDPTVRSQSPSPAPIVRSKSPLPDEEPPSPTESELGERGQNGLATAEDGDKTVNGKPVQSSQEIFDEHKRKQLVRDMEEKIAINPTEPEMLEPARRRNEEMPVMSATSYPGQEWNPYGDGFEDYDE